MMNQKKQDIRGVLKKEIKTHDILQRSQISKGLKEDEPCSITEIIPLTLHRLFQKYPLQRVHFHNSCLHA